LYQNAPGSLNLNGRLRNPKLVDAVTDGFHALLHCVVLDIINFIFPQLIDQLQPTAQHILLFDGGIIFQDRFGPGGIDGINQDDPDDVGVLVQNHPVHFNILILQGVFNILRPLLHRKFDGLFHFHLENEVHPPLQIQPEVDFLFQRPGQPGEAPDNEQD